MKGVRKNIKLKNQSEGFERRQEILDEIDRKGTYLPRSVDYEDMDVEFLEFIKSIDFTINGKKLPVIFQTISKWGEFLQTWEYADEFKNIKLPFITVVKKLEIEPGTNQNGLWNEDGVRKYIYQKVPTWDGNRKGVDLYKIPQPTSVDIVYEIRLFNDDMVSLNKFNQKLQVLFQSRQHYIDVKGHPMPIHLEDISDESKISDLATRKYYIQSFEMKLLGYILDGDEYEIVPTINRVSVNLDLVKEVVKPSITITKIGDIQLVNYDFLIKPQTNNRFKFVSEYDMIFDGLTKSDNIESIIFKVNGKLSKIPFSVNSGDTIKVEFTKDFYEVGEFNLKGRLI